VNSAFFRADGKFKAHDGDGLVAAIFDHDFIPAVAHQ